MRVATAPTTAYIETPGFMFPAEYLNRLIARPRRSQAEPRLADRRFEDVLNFPSTVLPAWLEDTLRALRSSVAPSPQDTVGDGRWLSQDVVNAAADFFKATADLLPGRPFIYSSRSGDLVAEFGAKNKALTAIVSPKKVWLFAAVNDATVERVSTDAQHVRDEVQQVTRLLRQ